MVRNKSMNLFLQVTNLSNVTQTATLMDVTTVKNAWTVDIVNAANFVDVYGVSINGVGVGFPIQAPSPLSALIAGYQAQTDSLIGANVIVWSGYALTATTSRLIAYVNSGFDVVNQVYVGSPAVYYTPTSIVLPSSSQPISVVSRSNFTYRQLLSLTLDKPYTVNKALIQASSDTQASVMTNISLAYDDINGDSYTKVHDLFLRPNQFTKSQLFTEEPFNLDGTSTLSFSNLLAYETVSFLMLLDKQADMMSEIEENQLIKYYYKQPILL